MERVVNKFNYAVDLKVDVAVQPELNRLLVEEHLEVAEELASFIGGLGGEVAARIEAILAKTGRRTFLRDGDLAFATDGMHTSHTLSVLLARPRGSDAARDRIRQELERYDLEDVGSFRKLLQDSMKALGMSDMEGALAFDVPRPSVTRWREGTTAPQTALRKVVVDELKRRVSR